MATVSARTPFLFFATREMYESFTADQHAQLEAHVKTMLADGAASNEIEARTALEKHGGDAALARDWLAQQAKAAGGLAEVTWASDVHLDDYSNMEQVKPGVWLASRVVPAAEATPEDTNRGGGQGRRPGQ